MYDLYAEEVHCLSACICDSAIPASTAQVAAPRRKLCPFQVAAPRPAATANACSLLTTYSRVKAVDRAQSATINGASGERWVSALTNSCIALTAHASSPVAATIISTPCQNESVFEAGRYTDMWDRSQLILMLLFVRNQFRKCGPSSRSAV